MAPTAWLPVKLKNRADLKHAISRLHFGVDATTAVQKKILRDNSGGSCINVYARFINNRLADAGPPGAVAIEKKRQKSQTHGPNMKTGNGNAPRQSAAARSAFEPSRSAHCVTPRNTRFNPP
jgi:hypothetical protein